ncbi:fructose-6-phosphate aldolase [Carnobacterium sp. PL24RED07]|uniref:fructose-6-phosphate aldolase n=1 Tax=Lactobacillales TaxID=186826 RepID=UPI00066186E4|nr:MULTISPECIES: fructose-6-phosphate aldolase [unclassified Carnobacterium]KAF3299294.1 fructose-6-phosphate aldolase [Carnobacterium sp. PL12RED10]KAF3299447.1 fructose-6-phosphate aldolase [Carnobacterium sp. PL26RED25]KAF3301503.1 fructose-6-phosphate aldolase [Carnobacterium sp. PL17RED31]KAF3304437.1 fructose-6-phosphate aldolase [Carnobacterium sp. PL24RED07]
MRLIIDSANIEKIQEYVKYLPVEGVTTNPSILKKEGKIDFAQHIKQIREIIGTDKSMHVQTIASDYEGILKDAETIQRLIGEDTYIKIPANKDGLAAIKTLKAQGVKITATAIYNEIQAILATEINADFLAPYVNRMSNLNNDPYQAISNIYENIKRTDSETKILAASFKNVDQVLKANLAGAEFVTVGTDVADAFLADANINHAVTQFTNDWNDIHNKFEI